MKKIRRLIACARTSAELRGHRLGLFSHNPPYDYRESAIAECRADGCSAYVQVMAKPRPNEINIGGTAVALDCPVAKR